MFSCSEMLLPLAACRTDCVSLVEGPDLIPVLWMGCVRVLGFYMG